MPIILAIASLGIHLSEIWINIQPFWYKKTKMKMSPVNWRPSRLGLNVLHQWGLYRGHGHHWLILIFCALLDEEPPPETMLIFGNHSRCVMASQIIDNLTIWLTACSRYHQIKQSVTLLTLYIRGIHWWLPHKGPIMRKGFPCHDRLLIRGVNQSPLSEMRKTSWNLVFANCCCMVSYKS